MPPTTRTASATLAFPSAFKLIIDRGFARGGHPDDISRWFEYLLLLVLVLNTLAQNSEMNYPSWVICQRLAVRW